MSEASELIATLPFVRSKPDGNGREFWHITPTGEYQTDRALGHGFAVLALELALAIHSPYLIGWIVDEMGRVPEWRSVERGFIAGLTSLALSTMATARGNAPCACAALERRAG
jgi:hypothetical protein